MCVSPKDIDTYASLLRVFIEQHIRGLMPEDFDPDGQPPVLFVLDKLPRLRYMPPIEAALDSGRGYKIRLWMFVQNIGQLEAAYPNADGMIGNCDVRTFMNPSLHDGTAKQVAEQIGSAGIGTTVDAQSTMARFWATGPLLPVATLARSGNRHPFLPRGTGFGDVCRRHGRHRPALRNKP